MDFMTAATSGRSVVFAYDDILPNQIMKKHYIFVSGKKRLKICFVEKAMTSAQLIGSIRIKNYYPMYTEETSSTRTQTQLDANTDISFALQLT